MEFQVLVEAQPRPVEIEFGGERELAIISRWRASAAVGAKAAVRDTVEFARLAAKRWRYYRRSISTARSLAEFKTAVRNDARAEISLLVVARADWFQHSPVLGLAQCRRTYCHHLILDFLSVHPRIVGGDFPRVRGVGGGLVNGLAELATSLGIRLIWGEATAYSAAFYAKTLAIPEVLDHFFMDARVMGHCCRNFRESQKRATC